MKHAGLKALSTIPALLAAIRRYPALTEKRPGIFYLKSGAFLHFHEDPAGLFADVKVGKEFQRTAVNTAKERAALVKRIESLLAGK